MITSHSIEISSDNIHADELERPEKIIMDTNINNACELACSMCNDTFQTKEEFINHSRALSIQLPINGLVHDETMRKENYSEVEQKQSDSSSPYLVRPFKCCLCKLMFDRMSQLDRHRRSVHHQERSQICQICGKGFYSQTDLKTHLNIHLGTNRCICEVCGRKFNHVSNLTRHSRIHSGAKPYPCSICGKRFTQINTLVRHKAIHNRGYQSIDCCFCDKQYRTESRLKEHMKKLHGVVEEATEDHRKIMKRQHHCKICGESFQFVELLRDHEKNHQNFKTLDCRSCNQKFHKTDEIKEHRCGNQKLRNAGDVTSKKIISDENPAAVIVQSKSEVHTNKGNESVLKQLKGINEDTYETYCRKMHTLTELLNLNDLKHLQNNEFEQRLCQNTDISPEKKHVDNQQTKETVVYVTSEHLSNMNTKQVVDTANHFLQEHLMELASENSTQAENMNSRYCDDGTAVSDMINSCWKEIEISDESKPEVPYKHPVSSEISNQNILYVQSLHKDGLILLNESGRLCGNVSLDVTLQKCHDLNNDSNESLNLIPRTEHSHTQKMKFCEKQCVKRPSDLTRNENSTVKVPGAKELNQRQTRELKSQHSIDNVEPTEQFDNDRLQIESTSPLSSENIEELLKSSTDNINTIVSRQFDNQEPSLRLVQTENGEQFYELLISNYSEKSENSLQPDRKSAVTVNENIKIAQNDPLGESLLKLVQLENGQRVLGISRSTMSDKPDIANIPENLAEMQDIEKVALDTKPINGNSETLSETNNDKYRAKSLSQNKSEKFLYLTQSDKDNLIDFFEIETFETQEQVNFNLVSDVVGQNMSQTSFDNPQILNRFKSMENYESPIDNDSCEDFFRLIQSSPSKSNDKNKSESKQTKREEGPMVRLVQNEDGAQFFELIRGDMEFAEPQELEVVEANKTDSLTSCTKMPENSRLESSPTVHDINDKTKREWDPPHKKKHKNNSKKYSCDVCQKLFSKGYNYKQHVGTHFANRQKFKCKECGKLFAWKSTFNKHMASHRAGGQQKFVCEICPKVYTTWSQVNEHVKRDHLKERNHKCIVCPKTFFKKWDLNIHLRTHTKERPYECRVCHKSFHHQSHVIRHERIHSGERPYACNICDKTFTQPGSLKTHRQRHQELKIDILDYQMDEDDPLPQPRF
ncbi:zinc finger protein 420-like isoform X1 [Athalia rosae]|uniref:zinc finger protein 420-like isoform X1 n=1 Tax=Athalia rosae TaxID=37344 RepID=UPI0020347919|nr:zinc finger protein 420-like isoform X1 [Athalia rosae]